MKLPFFKKADILLLAVLLAIGAVSLAFAGRGGSKGTKAIVKVDGRTVAEISLSSDHSETVKTRYGSNTLVVENGAVRMGSADCSGRDCMHSSPISKSGQVIICLPHHLSVTVSGGEDAPDAVIH